MTLPPWGAAALRNAEATVSAACFAVMVLVISANVVVRFVTGDSLVFTEEIAYLSFGWSIFMGVAFLYRQRAMIAIDLLVEALPAGPRLAANLFAHAILLVSTAFFCFLSARLASLSWVRRTAFLEIPYFWVNLAPAVGFGLMTVYSAWFLYRVLQREDLPSAELEEQM